MWPPRPILRNLALALSSSRGARACSGNEQASYTQGQSPEPRTREYFYYVDHQGQVCLARDRKESWGGLENWPRAGKSSRGETQEEVLCVVLSLTCRSQARSLTAQSQALTGHPVRPTLAWLLVPIPYLNVTAGSIRQSSLL